MSNPYMTTTRPIPMSDIPEEYRDIRARFDGGNYRALAVQFRLSERQIRKIINGTRS